MSIQNLNRDRLSRERQYVAEYPEVGTVDRGEMIEQAIAGLKEATRLYLEEFPLPEISPSVGD